MENAFGAARNAVDLVKRLMTVVRVPATEPVERFDVVELVREAVALAHQIFRGAIAVTPRLAVTAATVRGNRAAFQQVLLNLLINARDALEGRANARIEVDVEAGAGADAARPQVEVRIRDNGCGMDDETLRHLGEPFFTTKAPGAGTGLGLATAFATVRGIGGQLTCASTVGVGTEFVLALPTVAAPVTPARAAGVATRARHGVGRVLIVDDDAAVRRIVGTVLTRRGFEVVEVETGDAALAAVDPRSPGFDVALVDLSLGGGMSGEQVLRELNARAPTLPVVIMSGFIDAPERLARAAAVLEKPVSPDELAACLASIIDPRR